jgi:hypothetical protein
MLRIALLAGKATGENKTGNFMKKLFFTILIIFILFTNPGKIYAAQNASGSSASLQSTLPIKGEDSRAKIISSFLEKYSSPLVSNANDFIKSADDNRLDFKLVVAISGVESTFGKQVPYNSYNAWGWGIYGDNMIIFSSWADGIKEVSKGLRINYIDKWGATNIYEIGRIYASDPNWATKVDFFMQKITEFQYQNLTDSLSISL